MMEAIALATMLVEAVMPYVVVLSLTRVLVNFMISAIFKGRIEL